MNNTRKERKVALDVVDGSNDEDEIYLPPVKKEVTMKKLKVPAPVSLPPIYKGVVRKPVRRDFMDKNKSPSEKYVSISDLCKCRYLRINPNHYNGYLNYSK